MKIIDCSQRSSEWLEAKCGRVSGSKIADALAVLKRKEGESQARKNYKGQIVAEILTGRCTESYVSDDMLRGIDQEPFARASYEIANDREVDQVGFVLHPTIERGGCSPDGLLGKHGGVEFKCPRTTTHLDYIIADRVPPEYEPQVMWCIACCERDWWDFCSYDPRLPDHLQLFQKRLYRDEKRIAEMEAAVLQFLEEVDQIIANLPRPDGTRPDLVPILTQSLQQVQQ